eukprot:g646.t1
MRHEIAFALGQTEHASAILSLRRLLADETEDEVTRHEAAESLSTLDGENCKQRFEIYSRDRNRHPILSDTCMLALEGRRRFLEGEIDAAFAPCGCQKKKVVRGAVEGGSGGEEIMDPESDRRARNVLLDKSASLYDRYEALFELRDRTCSTDLAAATIAEALRNDRCSACFRHELAFTLGIFGIQKGIERILVETLANSSEHGVVRHEAALALQCFHSDTSKRALQRGAAVGNDELVRESCVAALAMRPFYTEATDESGGEVADFRFGFGEGPN